MPRNSQPEPRNSQPEPRNPQPATRTPFDPKTAALLIKKYGLQAKTARDWKSRGYIPSKYNDPNFKEPVTASDKELQAVRVLIELPWLIHGRLGLPKHRFVDFLRTGRKQVNLKKKDITVLKKSVGNLKKKMSYFIKNPTEKNLQKLLDLQLIRTTKLVADLPDAERLRKGIISEPESGKALANSVAEMLESLKVL